MAKIKIVDVSSIMSNNNKDTILQAEEYEKIGAEIAESFEKTGFVFVTNHGIQQELIDKVFATSMHFFNLDDSVKREYRKGPELQERCRAAAAGQNHFSTERR